MSIKAKLMIAFVSIVSIFTLFIYFYVPYTIEKQAMYSAEQKVKSISEMTAFMVAPALFFEDSKDIYESLKGTFSNKDLSYIVICNKNDSIIYTNNYVIAREIEFSKIDSNNQINKSLKIFKGSSDIIFHEEKIGKVYIGLELNDIFDNISQLKISFFLLAFPIFIGEIILFSLIFGRVIKQLKNIIKKIKQMAKGDYTTRIDYDNNDEIGDLVSSFNIMAEEIDKANKKLKEEIEVRILAEKELTVAKDNLSSALSNEKELGELKTRFVSMVSHEYRTPLTLILSSTYLLEIYYKRRTDDEFKKHIAKVQESVQSMTDMLSSVLTINKFDNKKIKLKTQNLDIIDMINDLIAQLQIIDGYKHNILFEHEEKEFIIDTDRNCINHIFTNLISNALKYSLPGRDILLKLRDNRDFLHIEIADEGIGIPDNEIARLYEPFFRAKNVGTLPGTGLGLAIVKRYIDFIGGELIIESQIDKGSTFRVILPKTINIDISF
ncbi:MAG: hypothetical protein QG635_1193 [Bacteroidota bacterium]|nr:hypothetical protein [Bacteroidota bacterium]